ncbi:zinc dependent phospholipase C family protein [Paenibacillus rhizovicinus]|uniref:Zinc dependent phospholipase C family protein n=1 Tax=Paenibacillus rhizovicinus TaxID=2704463 RepID=A0A6C0P6N4_9BACL|nr:zinc dependent phospholipase C family protein [Paenibacillus rhizovicinus]QHW33373.1 zinc dependent phospholipase C family protein [Paenibacillus rhizovicinus]
MPNVWTHFLFGQRCLRMLGEETLIAHPARKRLFNMGCQGPDFLFYHHFLPWQKDKTMNKLGSAMHERHCGPALLDMLDAVDHLPDSDPSKDDSLAYALGFLLHHLLDRVMHPYVFSRSGFRKWDHQRFEVMMDTLIVRKLLGIDTWKTEVWREIDMRGALPDAIVDAFEQISAVHYSDFAPLIRREQWRGAMGDMIRAQRLFHDPSGIKRVLTFGQIDPFVYKRHLPKLDILNESRRPWLDPTDGQTRHDDDIWMLWDRAMDESKPVLKAVLLWLRCNESEQNDLQEPITPSKHQLREAASQLIGNRSYETGCGCDSGLSIRFEDPIWSL